MSAGTDRRKPVDGNGYELRTRMAGRVPVDRYTDVLNALITRANADLTMIESGRLSDTAAEREARGELRDLLGAARTSLIDALGHIQHIRDPRLRFTLGVITVGPTLMKEGLRDEAMRVVCERHARGKWGAVTPEELEANARSLNDGGYGRIVSRHRVGEHPTICVTEADRSSTHIMTIARY